MKLEAGPCAMSAQQAVSKDRGADTKINLPVASKMTQNPDLKHIKNSSESFVVEPGIRKEVPIR